MTVIKKVLANNVQALSSAEQARARANIDASKVNIRAVPTFTGSTSTELQELVVDPGAVTTVTKKSLVLISVYTAMTLTNSTPADLMMSVELRSAFKIGMSDGDGSLSNSSCSYGALSINAIQKFSTFMTVLEAGQSVKHTYTFHSTVAGFTAAYSINQIIVELE